MNGCSNSSNNNNNKNNNKNIKTMTDILFSEKKNPKH